MLKYALAGALQLIASWVDDLYSEIREIISHAYGAKIHASLSCSHIYINRAAEENLHADGAIRHTPGMYCETGTYETLVLLSGRWPGGSTTS